MASFEVDIDVDDFYYELSHHEKRELVELLKRDRILDNLDVVIFGQSDGSALDHEWVDMLNKLNKARYRLTPEQEAMLCNLIKQL